MFDWNKIVREKLSPLPMGAEKLDEVVQELSQQLEDAYHEALERGATKAKAARIALNQFQDWEKFRGEVCESAEGSHLPVWQSKGFASPHRPAVWIAFTLCCTFFLLPSFRKALHVLPAAEVPSAWDENAFSEEVLARLEKSGDTPKYARALAYVALHSPDESRILPAAEKAIALDPQLTWISAQTSHANHLYPGYDPSPWLDRLAAWDPDNAYVYLLKAGAAVHSGWETNKLTQKFSQGRLLAYLAADPAFRSAMEMALSAPRYDSYAQRQFEFDRKVLLENGLDRPDKLLSSMGPPLPDFTLVELYLESLRSSQAGGKGPQEVQTQHALVTYQSALALALRIPTDSGRDRWGSLALRRSAYEGMIPLLRREGKTTEADFAFASLAALDALGQKGPGSVASAMHSAPFRAGRVLMIAGFSFSVLLAAVLAWLASVVLLRVSPSGFALLNPIASRLAWALLGAPIAGLAMLICAWPYSQSIAGYADAGSVASTYGPFLFGARAVPYWASPWIDSMFWSTMWCFAVLALGMVALFSVRYRRYRSHQPAE